MLHKSTFQGKQKQPPEKFCKKGVLRRPQPATLVKKRFWHRSFPMNFANFLRTPFLTSRGKKLMWKEVYFRLIYK